MDSFIVDFMGLEWWQLALVLFIPLFGVIAPKDFVRGICCCIIILAIATWLGF